MILEHVPDDPRLLEVLAPRSYSYRLGNCDLHFLDVLTVPQRLEDRIGKTENENVLDSFLAEVVIDAIDLVLVQAIEDRAVQCPGGVETPAERLLDHDPIPGPLAWRKSARRQPALRQLGQGRREYTRRDCEVEHPVALVYRNTALDLVEASRDVGVNLGRRKVSCRITYPVFHPCPRFGFHAADLIRSFECCAHGFGERFMRHCVATDSEQRKAIRKHPVLRERVQRRQELASRQVSARSENHHRAALDLHLADGVARSLWRHRKTGVFHRR